MRLSARFEADGKGVRIADRGGSQVHLGKVLGVCADKE